MFICLSAIKSKRHRTEKKMIRQLLKYKVSPWEKRRPSGIVATVKNVDHVTCLGPQTLLKRVRKTLLNLTRGLIDQVNEKQLLGCARPLIWSMLHGSYCRSQRALQPQHVWTVDTISGIILTGQSVGYEPSKVFLALHHSLVTVHYVAVQICSK